MDSYTRWIVFGGWRYYGVGELGVSLGRGHIRANLGAPETFKLSV